MKVNKKSSKISNVAEVLGLIMESHRDKEWLLQEIKRHKIKITLKSTMNVYQILQACPEGFISHMLRVLKYGDFEPIINIPVLVKTFHWFYTDLVAASDPAKLTKDQARNVWALYELIGRTETFRNRDLKSDMMNITGDGMNIGFADSPEKPLRLAVELHKLLSKYNQTKNEKHKLKIRIGIDTGPVYIIKDVTGRENYWGPGIIMARRVMDLARPLQILASERIANYIRKLTNENKSLMHYAGEYKIKHGEKLKIYNIYGEDFGIKKAPANSIIKSSEEPENLSLFMFNRIELKLEITDPITMMCHHTWLWAITNVTDKPQDQVSYKIFGDVPKDFAEMNVVVRDGDNKKLKMVSLEAKETIKKIVFKLTKPINSHKTGILKLEYDWEEPDRTFSYMLGSNCKKFKYSCVIPRDIEIKPRVLKVDPATNSKRYANPPEVKYQKNKTEIVWQTSSGRALDEYQFNW